MHIGTSAKSPRNKIEVRVLVEGKEQPLYRRTSDDKIFVVGTPGSIYTLQVSNQTHYRIEVINTVDGRHTLNDEPGDTFHNSGLVFEERSTGSFTGWRLDANKTREFVFGTPEDGIAAQATGSTSNVGVIGFAVYTERLHLPAYRGFRNSQDSFSRLGSKGFESFNVRGGSVGTGMGAEQEDRIGQTYFSRDGDKPDILVIGYDTEEVLRHKGIIAPPEPNPFPGMQTGYTKYKTVG